MLHHNTYFHKLHKKTTFKVESGKEIRFAPIINVNYTDLIGFSFSLNYESAITDYNIVIGLGTTNNSIVGLRRINKKYDLYISNGTNISSVPFLQKPINSIQDKTNPKQNLLYRPEIVYTCIQDNVTETFTIYEENNIIFQVNKSDSVYDSIIPLLQNKAQLYVNNLKSSRPLLVSYYTSEEILANHAKLVLRRLINNITRWISFNNFTPSFYTPSFRNLSTAIVDNISNNGKITNQTNISSDVITFNEEEQYILRPTRFTDITRNIAFSFNILEPEEGEGDFEIGFSIVNNVFKHVILKRVNDKVTLEIGNIKRVPLNFEDEYYPATTENKILINEIRNYNNKKMSFSLESQSKIDQLNQQIKAFQDSFNVVQNDFENLSLQLVNLKIQLEVLELSASQDITNTIIRDQITTVKNQINEIETSSIFQLKNQLDFLLQSRNNETTRKKQLDTSQIEIQKTEIELTQKLEYGEGFIYTMVQDNTLGIFSLFMNEKLIGQITLNTKEYKEILPEMMNGLNIYMCGMMYLRFYSPQYIYNSSSNDFRKYIDRLDHFYFVRKEEEINNTQIVPYDPTPVSIRLRVTDPIKYFIWYMKVYDETTQQPIDILDWSKYGFNIRDDCGNLITIDNMIKSMKIKMYGVDREREREENWFTYAIPWNKYVTTQSLSPGEYMYSFALYPMILQPSGAANYTEIDDSVLIIEFTNEVETILRENKNIQIKFELWGRAINHLRINSGMGALLFFKER